MRVIKFRVWHKQEQRMYPVVAIFQRLIDISPSEDSLSMADVDEVDLMQFTGLRDSKGNEIYEGDIVRYGLFALNDINTFGDEPWKHLPEGTQENDITTEQLRFAVDWKFSTLCALEQQIFSNPDVLGVEVIGNIYEHPELLSQKAGEG